MSRFAFPFGTTDPNMLALQRHVALSSDRPEAGTEGYALVSNGEGYQATYQTLGSIAGSLVDAQVPEGVVKQHEGALAIACTQLTGDMPDARIAESNVTQHEAALTIAESQITDGSILARVASNETISGQWTFGYPVRGPSGSSAAPGLSFADATGIGFYQAGGVLLMSAGGGLSALFQHGVEAWFNDLVRCPSNVETDVVAEYSDGVGVTVDGVELKDGGVSATTGTFSGNLTAADAWFEDTVYIRSQTGDVYLYMDSGIDGPAEEGTIVFRDGSELTPYWQLGSTSAHAFRLYDAIYGGSLIYAVSDGDMTLGPAGDLILDPNGGDVIVNTTLTVTNTSAAHLYLISDSDNSETTYSRIYFRDYTTDTWVVQKTNGNAFQIYDLVGGASVLLATQDGDLTISPTGHVIVSSATTSAYLYVKSTTDNAYIILESGLDGSGVEQSQVIFRDGSSPTSYWSLTCATDHSINFYDYIGGLNALAITSNGNMTLSPAGGGVTVTNTLWVGTADTAVGTLILQAGGTGQPEGGELRLVVAPDYDTNVGTYYIDAHQDRMRFVAGSDVFMYYDDSDDTLYVDTELELNGDLNHDGSKAGFFATAPVSRPTGVAVSAAGIHAALCSLGLITA